MVVGEVVAAAVAVVEAEILIEITAEIIDREIVIVIADMMTEDIMIIGVMSEIIMSEIASGIIIVKIHEEVLQILVVIFRKENRVG